MLVTYAFFLPEPTCKVDAATSRHGLAIAFNLISANVSTNVHEWNMLESDELNRSTCSNSLP